MKKRKFIRANSEKEELIKRINWLKQDVESKMAIIKRLFKERNEKRQTVDEATHFEIYRVCNSYESGFGHGVANDGFDLSKTPHSEKHLGEAYQIGYDAGKRRRGDAQ